MTSSTGRRWWRAPIRRPWLRASRPQACGSFHVASCRWKIAPSASTADFSCATPTATSSRSSPRTDANNYSRGDVVMPSTLTSTRAGQAPAGEQSPQMMKAIAVIPGRPGSVHLAELPKPMVSDIPGGRGVLVRVLRVGVDGTDKEINAAEYGEAPEGSPFLTLGHESFGVVAEIGARVTELMVGDYVVATVRRPGMSIYDRIGTSDMTTDDVYFERGISRRHGFLTEHYVEDPEFLVKVPQDLGDVGVLLEPTTVVEKGIAQAFEIQRRLRVWHPKKAAVIGAGTIGLLATLALRLRGVEVTTFARQRRPYLNSDLVEGLRARYASAEGDGSFLDIAAKYGPFDLIFEASGFA